MSDFELFKKINMISDLPESQIKKLFSFCKRVTFDVGEIIMEEGEENYGMFFFLEGEAIVSNTMTMKASHRRGGGFSEVEKSLVKLSSVHVGVLGEMSVFEDLPRSATVKAYTPCVLYEIKKADFKKFLIQYPNIGVALLYKISRVLCHRVRRSNKDIIKLSTALSIALSK